MEPFDKLHLLIDLEGETCQLNHGMYHGDTRAFEYLIIPCGEKSLAVPICNDCAKTLYSNDKEWVLFFCINCGSSQWKIRELLHQQYPEGILQLMNYCLICK